VDRATPRAATVQGGIVSVEIGRPQGRCVVAPNPIEAELAVLKRAIVNPKCQHMPTETNLEAGAKAKPGKYLTFILGEEYYGIPVLKVREIIRLVPITLVPKMPDYIKGVLNLRGKIIPVVDLRQRFGLAGIQDTERTCIVVVQVEMKDGLKTPMGLIVDAVEEVLSIAASEIEPTPDFGTKLDTDYLQGMAKVKGTVKALLDIDRVIAAEAGTSLTL
jgi:purine-binding chemotaxis protein CheW